MSQYPYEGHFTNAELGVEARIFELPTPETQAWKIAQMTPDEAQTLTDVRPEILLKACQIGMIAAENWQERADWIGVYTKTLGPSDYI